MTTINKFPQDEQDQDCILKTYSYYCEECNTFIRSEEIKEEMFPGL